MNLLLAEDDTRLGQLMVHMLKREGYYVDWVKDGQSACEYAEECDYDLIILDWMMPERSGIEVANTLRKNGKRAGILMLTAKDSISDRVTGLDSGVDDYLIKPFEFAELFARLRSLLRRAGNSILEEVWSGTWFKLNRTNQTILKGDEVIQLSPKEFQLLDILIQNKGLTVQRDKLLDAVWGFQTEVTSNVIEATVRLLRKKIDPPTQKKSLIQSVRGVGYKFED